MGVALLAVTIPLSLQDTQSSIKSVGYLPIFNA